MKPANQPKPWTPHEAVNAIQLASVNMTTVVGAACCGGNVYGRKMNETCNRIMDKAREAVGVNLGDRIGEETTWADVRIMLVGYMKICIEEMEAANK